MAGDLKNKYGTPNQAITCTLASLANTAARQATAVDNTTNLFTDVLVQVKVKSGASGTATTGYVQIYVVGTTDSGTTYTAGATGTDAAFTVSAGNMIMLGRLSVIANATICGGGPWSVAGAFGGTLPDHWAIVVENQSGGALDATEANHLKIYQGVYGQYT